MLISDQLEQGKLASYEQLVASIVKDDDGTFPVLETFNYPDGHSVKVWKLITIEEYKVLGK